MIMTFVSSSDSISEDKVVRFVDKAAQGGFPTTTVYGVDDHRPDEVPSSPSTATGYEVVPGAARLLPTKICRHPAS